MATAAAVEARAAVRVRVAAVVEVLEVVNEVVIEGEMVAAAVIVAQVTSVIVAVASLATGAKSSAQAKEGPKAVVVAAVEATVTAAAVVDLVPGTDSEMEVARDSFRTRQSGAWAIATATTTAKTREVAGGMAKEAVAVDKSCLEPTRWLLLRSDLASVQRVAPNRDLVLDPSRLRNTK